MTRKCHVRFGGGSGEKCQAFIECTVTRHIPTLQYSAHSCLTILDTFRFLSNRRRQFVEGQRRKKLLDQVRAAEGIEGSKPIHMP
jgi:hypothetical protein